jgi:xanthine/uracil permease
MAEEILRQPGQIEIDDLLLVSFKTGTVVNLIDYLIEIVIYESIFTPFVTGEILLSDSRNLIKDQELLGVYICRPIPNKAIY